jgi:hypothetical protein
MELQLVIYLFEGTPLDTRRQLCVRDIAKGRFGKAVWASINRFISRVRIRSYEGISISKQYNIGAPRMDRSVNAISRPEYPQLRFFSRSDWLFSIDTTRPPNKICRFTYW